MKTTTATTLSAIRVCLRDGLTTVQPTVRGITRGVAPQLPSCACWRVCAASLSVSRPHIFSSPVQTCTREFSTSGIARREAGVDRRTHRAAGDEGEKRRKGRRGAARRRKPSKHARPFKDGATHEANGTAATPPGTGGEGPSARQPVSTVPPPLSMAEVHEAFIADDASAQTGASPSLPHDPVQDGGWRYDDVDPRTGQTHLDTIYESHLARIHALMAQPLPPLPPDGSLNPDFFLGFAHYHYRLRDEYRALIARELDVPVRAVRLSVAWSGRFNVALFNRVQRVCGVKLDRRELGMVSETTEAQRTSSSPSVEPPLPNSLAERVKKLVREINQRQSERLLSAQLIQASDPIPEVEFAMTRREEQWIAQLHDWIQREVLSPSVAVLVFGGNELYHYATTHSRLDAAGAGAEPSHAPPPTATVEEVTAVLAKDTDESTRQSRYVEHHWLKMFHSRQVVPRLVPMSALAARLAVLVLDELVASPTKADVPPDHSNHHDRTATSQHSVMATLPSSVQAFVRAVVTAAKAASREGPADVAEEDALYAKAFDTALNDVLTTEEPARRSTLLGGGLTWWRLCRTALLSQHIAHASSERSGVASEHDAHVYYRFSADRVANRGDLPVAFAHGAFLGGMSELHYLQHNRAALDAVVLHPNDIDFKKKFARRMKSGHSRLQMEAEAKASYETS